MTTHPSTVPPSRAEHVVTKTSGPSAGGSGTPAPTSAASSADAHGPVSARIHAAHASAAPVQRRRYIPALDGIRTLAVIAVVLYHLHLPWMSGGLLGVTMFFVISGFIITRLLLREYDANGRIDLKQFWIRRARRLLPAIVALVVVVIVLCAIFNRVMLTKMRPDILPSLLFFNNWWQISQDASYFAALGDPSPLTHFWSLAIEEQFYLIWPPLLMAMLSLHVKRPVIRRTVLVLAAASAFAMTALYAPGADPSRIYYGTDTRAFSLLLGVWLAFIPDAALSPRRMLAYCLHGTLPPAAPPSEAEKPSHGLDLVGCLGLADMVALFVFTNGYSAFPYRGGMLLCSLFTLMLIAACMQPEGLLAKAFSLEPLVWLGKRSYSIYLWHFPLLALMNPVADITADPWWETAVQLAVVLAAAELSYRFIETPFRHGLVGNVAKQLKSGSTPRALARRHPVPLALAGVLTVAAVGALAFVPGTSALSDEGAALLAQGDDDQGGSPANAQSGSGGAAGKEPATQFSENAYDVLMVGDSVSLRTIPDFEATFPHGLIDAKKNRQFSTGIDLISTYLANGQLGKIVVIALGTNGLVTDSDIDTIMNLIGPDRIAVFVTTRSPQPWVAPTNEAIARAADRYGNVRVIDWYALSEGRAELFDGDGTHLSSDGAAYYIQLIYQAVEKDLPIHPEDHVDQQVIALVDQLANTWASNAGAQLFKSDAATESR